MITINWLDDILSSDVDFDCGAAVITLTFVSGTGSGTEAGNFQSTIVSGTGGTFKVLYEDDPTTAGDYTW